MKIQSRPPVAEIPRIGLADLKALIDTGLAKRQKAGQPGVNSRAYIGGIMHALHSVGFIESFELRAPLFSQTVELYVRIGNGDDTMHYFSVNIMI